MTHDAFPTDRPAVVTCGLPYANGDLHIGHLRTYVAGDLYARALERLDQQTAFVCGSDMHGTPIAVNAAEAGVSPKEFAMEYHQQYKQTFPKFNVEFDNYGHTDDETNAALTREIVETLETEGYVYEKEIKVAWDPIEDQPLPDRFVKGTCPYCGATARGDECDEGCGRHLEPGEIEDPVSTITGNPAEYRERTHKFFEVSELAEYLSDFLDRLEGTDNAQNQPRQWIEEGLQDWCITRDLEWGIDYPEEDTELVLYVWVDAPIEYIASTKEYTERVGPETYDWAEAWQNDGEIVHIIGRDIIQHHTIFWPAMLHVADYTEPRAVCATGFITINGKGLSTSRNRAIWAHEYLEEGLHPDLLRYYLATTGGLQQDVDFSWEKFQQRVNGELADTLGNFLYRGLLFADRHYDGTPDTEPSEAVIERIETAIADFEAAVNEYAIRDLGELAVELAGFGNEYIQRNEPWKLIDEDPEAAATVIRDCVQLARAVTVLAEPIMPEKAAAWWDHVGDGRSVHEVSIDAALEAPAASFTAPETPFDQLEDDQIDTLETALEERIEETAMDSEESTPELEPLVEDRVDFETFKSLDLRVGRIESAEPIEGADELLRLEVDIGVETRQLVAGLRQLHDVDELPGTKIIVVANLEKAELFGVESNGMLLAAGDDADLLTTHGDAVPGERIE